MSTKETRKNIIRAGRKAVDELIKVAEEQIITDSSDDLAADRLKNAAATKKLCKNCDATCEKKPCKKCHQQKHC